jgi:hypothetical protein
VIWYSYAKEFQVDITNWSSKDDETTYVAKLIYLLGFFLKGWIDYAR